MRKLIALIFPGLLMFYSSAGFGSSGAGWLESRLKPDGSFQNTGDIAIPFQSTAEVLRTFGLIGNPITPASLQYLSNEAFNDTEQLARRIIANVAAGNPAATQVSQLLQRQNHDGGFGGLPGYDSNPLDTAFALEALAAAGATGNPVASATAFLLASQKNSGAWALGDNNPSVYITAIALKALWDHRKSFNVANALNQGRGYLLAQRDANGSWATVFESALSLIAIVPTLIERDSIQGSLQALRALQLPDGSFNHDVYQTALALRALRLAELPSPDEIRVVGRVLDGNTNLPLAGVTASLSGPVTLQQATNNNGGFEFADLQAGSYQLTLSLQNYGQLLINLNLQAGQQLNFGDLSMLPVAATPTTGRVIGTVTAAESGMPLAGARITLSGAVELATETTASGAYQFVNVAPGDYVLRVNAAGYLTVSGTARINSGQTLVFSPGLTPLAEVAVRVEGRVTARDTGQPLSGVAVSVQGGGNDARATTNDAGEYAIGNLQPGNLSVAASLDGYQTVTGSVTAGNGVRIDFSPALLPEGQPAEPQPGGVIGMVVDRTNGEGLAGVNVSLITASGTQFMVSGMDGEFSFSGIEAGQVTIRFEITGYQTRSATFSIAENTIINLGPVDIAPVGFMETAGIVGRVIDARTEQPLSGVVITALLNSGNRGFVTAQNGLFEFTGLVDQTGTLNFSLPGYEPASLQVALTPRVILNLGDIRLRDVDIQALLPDAAVQGLSVHNLVSDAQTLAMTGQLGVTLANRGNASIEVPLDILAFHDVNRNAQFDSGMDIVLGRARMTDTVAPDATVTLAIDVNGVLPFRDAPVSVWIDSAQTLVELSEVNNVESTAGLCASQNNPAVDLALCLDASGSVSAANFRLQLEGTAQALENPAIVPQDGSVRVAVIQFASASRVEIPPTIIESDNIGAIATKIRNIPKLGGGTAIHSCIDTATAQITGAMPASAQQVIDVSTDGASTLSLMVAASNRARNAGIDTLNAIGVGSANINSLNQIVFPQPPGGDRGFVIPVSTFQQYVTALSGKVQREVLIADLTVGRLELIDNGTGQSVSLRAVVGNSGTGSVSAGTSVRFYSGDPASGGTLIGNAPLTTALGSGEFRTVQLDGIQASQLAADSIVVVADIENAQPECGRQNNRTSIPARTHLGRITLVADQAAYKPNADAVFTMTVTNTGAVPGEFVVDLLIADGQGNIAAAYAGLPIGLLAAGAVADLTQPWNTGLILAGDYSATALLKDASGLERDRSSTSFAILETLNGEPLASLRTTTDRQQYHTSDTVRIENLLRNSSLSTLLTDTVLRLRVTSPSSAVLLDTALSVGGLSPGEFRNLFETLQLSGAEQGDYSVQARLEYAAGGVLAADQVQFTVVDDASLSLTGAVQVQSPQLFVGDTQVCNFNINNTGTVDLPAQELWQLLVKVSEDSEVTSVRIVQDLAAGAAADSVRSFATAGLTEGHYACVLQATVNGERLSLAHAVFRLEALQVRIDAELTLGGKGGVLVWMDEDEAERHCKEGGHGHKDKSGTECGHSASAHDGEPRLRIQRAWLEQALNDAGIAYTLVSSESAFTREFHSGRYNQYLLLAENPPIHPHFAEELREAVYRGEGLIVADGGGQPLREALREALGLKPLSDHDRDSPHVYAEVSAVEMFETELHTAARADLSGTERVLVVQADSAHVAGRFAGLRGHYGNGHHSDCRDDRAYGHGHDGKDKHKDKKGGCPPKPDKTIPAVAMSDYGDGRAVYVGFDALSEAARDDAPLLFGEILLQALKVTQPATVNTRPGAPVPMVLGLTNRGAEIEGQAFITLPAGSRIIDAGGGTRLTDNSVRFAYDLAEDAQAEFTIWTIPAYSSGSALAEAVVRSGELVLATVQLYIPAQAAASVGVILQSLNAVQHEDRYLRQAWQDVKNAQQALSRNDADSALHHLLKATNELIRSVHPAAAGIRRDIDWLLWRLGSELKGDRRHD